MISRGWKPCVQGCFVCYSIQCIQCTQHKQKSNNNVKISRGDKSLWWLVCHLLAKLKFEPSLFMALIRRKYIFNSCAIGTILWSLVMADILDGWQHARCPSYADNNFGVFCCLVLTTEYKTLSHHLRGNICKTCSWLWQVLKILYEPPITLSVMEFTSL